MKLLLAAFYLYLEYHPSSCIPQSTNLVMIFIRLSRSSIPTESAALEYHPSSYIPQSMNLVMIFIRLNRSSIPTESTALEYHPSSYIPQSTNLVMVFIHKSYRRAARNGVVFWMIISLPRYTPSEY